MSQKARGVAGLGPGSGGLVSADGLLASFIPPRVMPARAVAARALAASVVEALEAGDVTGARAAARALVEPLEGLGGAGVK